MQARAHSRFDVNRSPAALAYQVVLLSMLNGIGMRGSKVLVSLYALDQGAGAGTVGIIAGMYALFPLLLAVHAGKLSDRIGDRLPIVIGGAVMALALALPFVSGHLAVLVACAALVGLGHIYFHVSIHNLLGSFGDRDDRTRSFSIFALGMSLAAFAGPSLAGVLIDSVGFRWTAIWLGVIALAPVLMAIAIRSIIPVRTRAGKGEETSSAFDLLQIPRLRRVIITGGISMTAIELYNFYFPVYGQSIGLSATVIGLVLSTYAIAGFAVRIFLHGLVRRFGEPLLLSLSLLIGAAVYAVFPLVTNIGVLAVLSFVLGLGLGMSQPLTLMVTYTHAPKHRSGEALGLRLMMNKVIQVAVPVAFGAMSATTGLVAVFWACAAFLAGGGVLSRRDRAEHADGVAASGTPSHSPASKRPSP